MHNRFNVSRNSAFSLVELSIVLVILGLLTGGILSGQSLIRAAELRALSTDISKYKTAVYTFRDKYFALPGDIANAASFWGTDSLGCPSGGGTTGTCNGNGDGMITIWPAANNTERYRVWQHLVYAGLIEGSYTGVAGPAPHAGNGTDDVIGVNLPQSKLENGGFALFYNSNGSGFYNMPNGAGHSMIFGKAVHATFKVLQGRIIMAEELWNIDTKLDDGRPDNGFIQANPGYIGQCTTSATSPADYILSSTVKNCAVSIAMGL